MRFFFTLLVSLSALSSYKAQLCNVTHHNFKAGEKVSYQVYYHLGFVWVSAGWVNFNTSLDTYNETEALHFLSYGKSYPKWDWVYKVNDKYESFVDKTNLSPLYFSRNVHENSLKHKEYYYFDSDKSTITSKSKKNEESWVEKELKMDKCMFDPITMIYYARCIPFEDYQVDDEIPLTLVIDNEIHEIFIRYLGKEKKNIKNQGTYHTLKFSALLVEGTIFKGGEGMTVWVTDDQNRVPLLIESEVLVGEILVVMNKTEGLKYPITSKVSHED